MSRLTLESLLHDEWASGTVTVRPGVTVSYSHDADHFVVTIDGVRQVTDMTEVVEQWVKEKR